MVTKKGVYILWIHDQQFSKEEVVVNPDHFPKLKVNDILEIASPANPQRKLCLRVKSLAPVKGALQISVAKYIASVFDFVSRREVIVNVIADKQAIVDFVELSFKDHAEILDEIPDIPRNSRGQLFQDFYKVVVSDETRQDWSSVIVNLKREFNNYHQMVNWDIYGRNSALGKNSTASQGNFLEAINLGMSYFDKHYIDRDFTRTGQMIVVVSPGTGIFEVEPEINLLTKQRMIDNGYGCDLICLNKQPLHIVPLFKYSNLHPKRQPSIDIKSNSLFNVPYWLAISFYNENTNSSDMNNIQSYNKFVPQFRIPDSPINYFSDNAGDQSSSYSGGRSNNSDFFVPKDPRKLPAFALQKPPNKYTSHTLGVNSYEDTIFNIPEKIMSGESNQPPIGEILDDYMQTDTDMSEVSDTEDIPNNTPSNYNHLLNRKRNSLSIKPSSSHERTSTMSSGFVAKKNQQHSTSYSSSFDKNFVANQLLSGSRNRSSTIQSQAGQQAVIPPMYQQPKTINPFTYDNTPFHLTSNRRRWSHLWFSPNTYIFGTTNTNPNPFLPNWKSLCEPASLPITTDYFPSQKDLLTKYIEYVHTLTLSPDENEYHNNTEALLKELISQRLAQGYQLIMAETPSGSGTNATPSTPQQATAQAPSTPQQALSGARTIKKKVYQLSLGHDFHVITYDPSNLSIQVKRYQRNSGRDLPNSLQYIYFLCTAYHNQFITQSITLSHQASGSYPWNTLDNLICGTISEIKSNLRYWRVQFAILPLNNNNNNNNEQLTLNSNNNNNTLNVVDNNHTVIANNQLSPTLQSPSLSPPAQTSLLTTMINSSNPIAQTNSTVSSSNNVQPAPTSASAPTSPVSIKSPINVNTKPSNSNQLLPGPNQQKPLNSNTTSPTTSQELSNTTSEGGLNVNAPEHTEDERVTSFTKFKEFVNSIISKNSNQTLVAANNNTTSANKMEVKIISTRQLMALENTLLEMVPSASLPDQHSLPSEYAVKEKLAPIDIDGIFNRMNLPQPIGLKMVDRKHRLRTYRKCFVGSEIIDWMLQNVDVISRDEAMSLCLLMVERKFIKAVEKNQFVDGFHYYRLKEDGPMTTTSLFSSSSSSSSNSTAQIKKEPITPSQPTKMPSNSSLSNLVEHEQQHLNSASAAGSTNSTQPNSPTSSVPTSNNNNNNRKDTSPTIESSPNFSPKLTRMLSSSYMDGGTSPANIIPELRNSVGTPGLASYAPGGNYLLQQQQQQQQSSMLSSTSTMTPSTNNILDSYENPNQTEEQKIEMDPSKTDRYEWIMMKYDKSFTPSRYYHIEFKWMVCTGCVVDEFVGSCIRKAKQFGLTLIQVPMEKKYSPFYAPTHIKLVMKLMQPEVIKVILAQFNFIPDLIRKRPTSLVTRNDLYLFSDSDVFYTEYIHRTGMLFVRVVEDGFMCIVNNAPSNRQFLPAALTCLKGFQDLVTQLNSTMPSIIYHTPDSPSLSFEDSFLHSGSPQSNLLRSLPPQEANFLSLFAQGYTAGDNLSSSPEDELSSRPNNDSNKDHTDNPLSSDNNISDTEMELNHTHPEAMWESQEIIYYSVMSRSPTI
ncbi:DEP domain containing protein [Heterostelium album PN500]|uniref:DEP domain containing protein n=1 Tax=Heterostelium pallidum (strain ATCC 26659 / Pp 5 / PN500) TaxID=670386 RepID=D3BDL8_HETP5|nr:DEP domain containing protein [Heterostelium album PN500]EFA79999.1 DEP domain containing protein [Heterostelium album PN500]|eukprot:XP_020432119.1 DEP domain containing protein [Heterostelium album PN500]